VKFYTLGVFVKLCRPGLQPCNRRSLVVTDNSVDVMGDDTTERNNRPDPAGVRISAFAYYGGGDVRTAGITRR